MSGANAPPLLTVSSNGVGVVPDALLNTFVQGACTITQLRSFSGIGAMTVLAVGSVTPGDGGGGTYYWNGTATAADNGTTVIAPNGVSVGRWLSINPPLTGAINQATTGQFYAENGAVIDRLNDRVFIGSGATVNSGNPNGVGAQGWLETLIPGAESFSVLTSSAATGYIGLTGATQSVGAPSNPSDQFGGAFYGVNNDTTGVHTVWAGYFEARHYDGALQTLGIESDIIALPGTSIGEIDPFHMFANLITANLWLSCARPDVSSANATVAIGILNNAGAAAPGSGQYSKGIVFDANALLGTTASAAGASCAIAMANGHEIQWFDSTGNVSAWITSAATASDPVQLAFGSGGVAVITSGGASAFEIIGVTSAVNYAAATNAITGSGPVIQAFGTDTNIALVLAGKGSGLVTLGAHVNMAGLPTSSSGLASGTVWNNSGVLNVV